jgi:DNA-binding MarR family transcriptional regulator
LNPQFSLERRLTYRFSVLSTLNLRCIGAVYMKHFGLSHAGLRIFTIIGRYEPIFPGVAAQRSTMDADKVTRAVDRLVELGYVIRNTDAADRRRVILCLSSRGKSVYEEVEQLAQTMDAEWRSVLSAQENAVFDGLMDKLDVQAREIFTLEIGEKRFAHLRNSKSADKKPAAKKSGRASGARRVAAR